MSGRGLGEVVWYAALGMMAVGAFWAAVTDGCRAWPLVGLLVLGLFAAVLAERELKR